MSAQGAAGGGQAPAVQARGGWGPARIGGLAFVVGVPLVLLSFLTHPQIPPGNIDAYIQEIAADPRYALTHLVGVVGFLGIFVGFFSLYRVLKRQGGDAYASLAVYAIGLGAPFLLLGFALDGFVGSQLVADHQAVTGEAAREASKAAINLTREAAGIIVVVGLLLMSTAVGLFGAALLRVRLYHRVLASLGLVLGLAALVGWAAGAWGPQVFSAPFAALFIATVAWLLTVGVVMLRAPPALAGAAYRNTQSPAFGRR